MSLTGRLISHIRTKEISAADREAAALIVLDTLACALAGRFTPQAEALKKLSARRGDGMAQQAFLFGGLAHIVEMDDLHTGSVTHPGTVVIPPALSMATALGLRGPDLLDAILRGYEACCRIGNSVGKAHYQVWHNTSTCGPFGAAMACADLMKLEDQQCQWALGNAGTQSSGLWQFLPDGAMSKHLHTARACEAGMTAAELAGFGFTGPAHILEGPQGLYAGACPDAEQQLVMADPEAAWQLCLTSMKPYPCCRHTHPVIDAAVSLAGRLDFETIESVDIQTYSAALHVCDRPEPRSDYQAKFSLQHTVLQALKTGVIGFDSFNDATRADLTDLYCKVELEVCDPYDAAYPKAWGAKIIVQTSAGNLEAETIEASGDPAQPLTKVQVIDKAKALMRLGQVEIEQADALIQACLALPQQGARLPRLHSLLTEVCPQASRIQAHDHECGPNCQHEHR